MTRFVGQPIDRSDAQLKVQGGATYAHEVDALGKPVYGVIVPATIAKGRIASIDTVPAAAVPGVLLVLTHRNAPPQAPFGPPEPPTKAPATRFSRARPCLADDRVRYWGESVAFVAAETFEIARHAASLIRIAYAAETPRLELREHLADAYKPAGITASGKAPTDSVLGDVAAALAAAPIKVEATYRTAYQSAAPMEPHAALAEWEGGKLTLHTSTQSVSDTRAAVAATLQLPLTDVRISSPYVGGGFGSKLGVRPEAILAAMGAFMLRRPLKVAQTRQQTFSMAGHRPASVQTVQLGATKDGQLTAISHVAIVQSTPHEEFAEQNAMPARTLYAAPNRSTTHRLVRLDLAGGEPVRAPGEAPGLLAFETAIDELAVAIDMDPVMLRILNEPKIDPEKKVPFSSRNLVRCMQEGSARFGWTGRPTTPGTRRDGRWLVGYGMASAIRSNYIAKAAATATLDRKGRVTVRTDMADIGTGTYTVLRQIAADEIGLPLERITVLLGDSSYPATAGAGGSWGAASAGSAVKDACAKLRAAIVAKAGGGDYPKMVMTVARGVDRPGLVAQGAVVGMAENPNYQKFSQHGFGAHFAEVGVDMDTGEIRLRRMLGVFAVGNLLNPKTARSQLIGGMIWGFSQALLESAEVDPRYGQFVNHDLGEYHVPVYADLPDVEALFVEEQDDKGNTLGIKGIGELGICGSAAAVGNAVFNATGVRVRDFPITLDKLLAGLPPSGSVRA